MSLTDQSPYTHQSWQTTKYSTFMMHKAAAAMANATYGGVRAALARATNSMAAAETQRQTARARLGNQRRQRLLTEQRL